MKQIEGDNKINSGSLRTDLFKRVKNLYVKGNTINSLKNFIPNIEDPIRRERMSERNNKSAGYLAKDAANFLKENNDGIILIVRELEKNGQYEIVLPLNETIRELINNITEKDHDRVPLLMLKLCEGLVKGCVVTLLNNNLMYVQNNEEREKISSIIDLFQEKEISGRSDSKLMVKIIDGLAAVLGKDKPNEIKANSAKKADEVTPAAGQKINSEQAKINSEQAGDKKEDALKKEVERTFQDYAPDKKLPFDLQKIASRIKEVKEEYKDLIRIRMEEKRRSYESMKEKMPESARRLCEEDLNKDKKIYSLYFENGKKALLLLDISIGELFDFHTCDGKGVFMNVDEKKAIRLEKGKNSAYLVPLW